MPRKKLSPIHPGEVLQESFFRDKEIEKVWARERAPKVPSALQRPAKRKLLILDAADSLQDLRVPLGKPSEKLTPARQGHYSVPLTRPDHRHPPVAFFHCA